MYSRCWPVAAVLALIVVAPSTLQAQGEVDRTGWMAGCWVAASGQNRSDEVWMAPEGGMMVGMSRTVRDDVARGYELAVLHVKDGHLTFSAYPSGQSPTDFRATTVSEGSVRFENPQHDFPKAIEYLLTTPDSLVAHVFGSIDTSQPAFSLRYQRGAC